MSLTAAASGLVVVLLSVQVIQGEEDYGVTYTPAEICAVQGSTVEMSCTFTYPSTGNTPVTQAFWFTKTNGEDPVDLTTDSDYSGRVQHSCFSQSCTLTITDLRESDAAEYKFTFMTNQQGGRFTGSPGVTVRVTDLQVKVNESTTTYWTQLTCHSSCRLPDRSSYGWYHSGVKNRSAISSTWTVGSDHMTSYVCAVEGLEDFHSPPVCVHGQSCDRVTYTDRRICAVKGSSVNISSTYNSIDPIKSMFWFSYDRRHQWKRPKEPEDLREDAQYAGRVQVLDTERSSTLRITDLRDTDSAQYRFTFKTQWIEFGNYLPGTTLTVTALQLQVIRTTVHQSDTEAELKCHSSCSPADRPSYVWFKNGEKVTGVETSTYEDRFHPEDSVSCALKGAEDFRSPPVYGPKLPSVSVSPSAEIVEGSSVTLTCSSDANPAATYTWYKEDGDPDLQPLTQGPQLIFTSIQSSDSAEYHCRAENELGRTTSENITVNVKLGA